VARCGRGSANGACVLPDGEHKGREAIVIEDLLRELAELRELDRRRNAHAPGSAAHDAATLEVDLRTRRVMDRFRDLKDRRLREPSPDEQVNREMDVTGPHRGGALLS